MSYANPNERNRLIAGLRGLADFLEERQEVPAPRWADIMAFPPRGIDDEMKREIDRIAALIESPSEDQDAEHLHYTTTRSFGPVSYVAIAILASSGDERDAQSPPLTSSESV